MLQSKNSKLLGISPALTENQFGALSQAPLRGCRLGAFVGKSHKSKTVSAFLNNQTQTIITRKESK